MALSPNPHEDESVQAAVLLRGTILVFTRIDSVVYRIQRKPRLELMKVSVDQLALYKGTAAASSLKEGAMGAVVEESAGEKEP